MKRRFPRPAGPRAFALSVPAILLALALAPPAGAETPGASAAPITLHGAVDAALRANRDLMRAEAGVESRRIALRRSKSEFLPSLGVSMRGSDSFSKGRDSLGAESDWESARSLSFSASSSLELFSGFSRLNGLKQARLDLQAQEQTYARSRQAIVYEAIRRFVQVVLDEELVAVNDTNLVAQRRQLEQVQAFYEAGRRPIADLYQQQAAVASAEASLLVAERNRDVSALELLQVMGAGPGARASVEAPDAESIVEDLAALVHATKDGAGIEKRPDLVAQRTAVEAAKTQVSISRAGYWPSVSLSAGTGTSYRDDDLYGSFGDQIDRNMNASIGLSASLSLFDRFMTSSSVAQAKVQLRQEEISLEDLELQARIDAEQAMADYTTGEKAVEVARAQLVSATQALNSIQERYRVNAATLLELLQARATYVQSAYNVASSKYGLLVKGAAVLYAAGDVERAVALFR